ncbi:Pre-mRNA-splicing factor SPF27 [Syncephalastrum racemosum]|uniref:Pre-mRNA-splicing factor SPF27 n=1 Tax=Syncephalastrum racemosum TaxID=13706 RepID=A0A1X2H345_SYNRA|nr:Pre-mRNA-splicing factor SPF27 [Syncephalastrum racemosum]
MRRMRRKADGDRSNLPSEIELFEAHEELKAEWERTKRREPLEALDTERYQLSAPGEDDPEAWQAAVNNSKAQLEAESNRLINLELLQKYGANAWRVHNYMLEAHLKRIQAANEDMKNKILQINRERKMDQTQAAGSLRSLEDKWSDLVSQNLQVDIACTALEQEVEELQRYKASLNK